jgi:hypothetical protein
MASRRALRRACSRALAAARARASRALRAAEALAEYVVFFWFERVAAGLAVVALAVLAAGAGFFACGAPATAGGRTRPIPSMTVQARTMD